MNDGKCIEDLSNELFYEIFEYLHADLLYEAFSNLNARFQHLLFHSTFLLKVQPDNELRSNLEDYCKNFWIPNKHRIISIYFDCDSLIDASLRHCMIDSSFHRLESIKFDKLSAEQLLMLLFYLKSLPRFSSLNAALLDTGTAGLGNIYRMIFSLPVLKYNQLMFEFDEMEKDFNVFVPLAMNESLSTVEYLNIDHNCTVRELFSIIDHTPQLRHLVCNNLMGSETINEQRVILSNLKYLSIECDFMHLNEFESLVKTLSSNVEMLNIGHHSGEDYFHADRWERMIKKHIPHLEKFDYRYHSHDPDDYLKNALYLRMNQFTSPFWTEQRWFTEVIISTERIVNLISSHKKRWFDDYEHEFISKQQKNTNKSSIKQTGDIQLTMYSNRPAIDQPFFDKYKTVFVAVPFTHLNIDHRTISEEMLVKIIQVLPNLDSLRVSSLQVPETASSGVISINNKISKVCYKNIIGATQVNFLFRLCRCMEHFQIRLIRTINLDTFIRLILRMASEFVPQLRSLRVRIPKACEITTHQLQNRIESDSLLSNYRIKRYGDYIHLQWD